MPKSIFDTSNPTKVVRRDKREALDKMLVEVNPNPDKNKKHASVEVHEVGLGMRGNMKITTMCTTLLATKEDPAQLTFVTVLGK
jgi:hypothetical protein